MHGPTCVVDGAELILASSNDYLGLTGHPDVQAAIAEGLEHAGAGAAASRLISGTHEVHREAEASLAALVGMDDALLFSSGYAANVGVLSTLPNPEDVVFSDALNHASIIDGCRLSRAKISVYPHGDLEHLEGLLRKRAAGGQAFLVTDALFSMDGDFAPLRDLRALADRYDAALIVDEAHSLGVHGPAGAGACASAGVRADLVVGTLGKSLGLWGAFAASSEPVCTLLENSARSFVFSTATSPAAAYACPTACSLARDADQERARVLQHAERIRKGLQEDGWRVPAGDSQIVPVIVGDSARTMSVSSALLERGVFVQGIRPPTVPRDTGRLRVAPMATHTDAMIDRLLEAFHAVRDLGAT